MDFCVSELVFFLKQSLHFQNQSDNKEMVLPVANSIIVLFAFELCLIVCCF